MITKRVLLRNFRNLLQTDCFRKKSTCSAKVCESRFCIVWHEIFVASFKRDITSVQFTKEWIAKTKTYPRQLKHCFTILSSSNLTSQSDVNIANSRLSFYSFKIIQLHATKRKHGLLTPLSSAKTKISVY